MLPGKTYKPEEFLRIFRKRIWLILVPWGIVAAATAGAAQFLPDLYRSQARIQMVPPKVPDSIMRPPTMSSIQERLRATEQVILSRTRLERLVKEFSLYPEKQQTQIMEDIVTDMRRDIVVAPSKGDVFMVQYVGRDPVTVLKVTERLAGYFIDESLKESVRRAEGTSAFVEGEVEEKERQLKEIEDRLTQYKIQYSGELPEQVGTNTAAIQNIQSQLSQMAMQHGTDLNRRKDLERMIENLQSQPNAAVTAPLPVAPTDPATFTGPASQKLALARQVLNAIIAQGLKPDHVRYQAAERQVRQSEKEVEAEEQRRSPVSSATAGMSPAEVQRLKALESYRAELETINTQIAQRDATEKTLRAKAADYQTKIDRAQLHAARMTEMNRDYGTLSAIYQSHVGKREAASSAVNLERRQIGEQFNMLDAAQLAQKPFSPDRLVYNVFGLAAGLAFGVALVVLLEYRDTTFKTDSELAGVLGLPVLAVVPLMQSDTERRTLFRRRLFMNVAFGGTAAVCFAVVAYAFIFLR